MMETSNSISNGLTLDETIERLSRSDHVLGLVLFGSRFDLGASPEPSPISDYDLLILVRNPPVRIFQMLSYIDGRMADVVFVETDSVEQLLASGNPEQTEYIERRDRYLMQKMLKAEIVYDPSGLLADVRRLTQGLVGEGRWPLPTPPSDLYAIWFWQNFGLLHIKRMVESDDPVYETATDMMLLNGLAGICRAYFEVRSLPWEGEKAAIRYLSEHDPDFLADFRACVAEPDRRVKVAGLDELIVRVIAPLGARWRSGETSVYLADQSEQPQRVPEALAYWERLLSEE